ncbi:hypothetical protein L917_05508 [Phytophthora nicotianae]|uniref:Uncharacterized protein n=3 Tax=Phytophthora nicotianae TaxID=4792 RepID=W2QGY7_PHYN3|nr:hypothetical protein PPTG_22593 [Phytophthora nicotianae INRA-310]ETI50669.1 hypothetical protein F443_05815 [Phytophthora nicotianae P1569]ETK90583.1 hypothetical protein L915_05683 [Phytophthora nicotianae]ETL97158.1 hypothetical protein L917_05508 [Phytophthora nicotianae]ETN11545.1 hypothetical protein PPTG_22593 [Phytophthora nicotianae INRA-310]
MACCDAFHPTYLEVHLSFDETPVRLQYQYDVSVNALSTRRAKQTANDGRTNVVFGRIRLARFRKSEPLGVGVWSPALAGQQFKDT